MNVLAHIYLSGDSDEIIIGNYIGDYVKGSDYLKYPELIKKGIILHRHIDDFTDMQVLWWISYTTIILPKNGIPSHVGRWKA